jgi:hypothetical protein
LSCNKFAHNDASAFFRKVRLSQFFENPSEDPSADKLCSWQKAKRATIPETQRTCLLRLLGSGPASGAGRKSNCANFLASLSASTTAIAYKREESRGDQANGSFWATRNLELCSTQHALRINIEANFLCRYGAFGATKEKEEADRGFI